ncbi:hypothetical protein BJX64DRAFT_261810 [Aspergillus heterothallicus]
MTSLLSLPLETLELIASHLADHKPSLGAFSQASKRCKAASRIRFHELKLLLSLPEDVESLAAHWTEVLHRNSAFSSVRHLTISGRTSITDEEEDDDENENDEQYHGVGNMADSVIVECDQGEDELTHCGHVYDDILRGRFYQLGVGEESDEVWNDLARFLNRLTGLREVVWACERGFPQCLLKVVHRTPGCQLHIKAFDPPRLVKGDYEDDENEAGASQDEDPESMKLPKDGFVDEYEYTLATSPSLTSLVVPVAHDDPHREYNEEAVQWMARGLAPNLKHVHIIDSGPGFKYRGIPPPSGPQKSINGKLFDGMKLGVLESLSLDPANETRLESWQNAIDFSHLRHLQLWRARKPTLARARSCHFRSLKSLALEVLKDRPSIDASPIDQAVAGFLRSLPPLRSLHITGSWNAETFKTALQHHGRALRKLSLYTSEHRRLDQYIITPQMIRLIGKNCPHLHDARLQVKRSAGDKDEQKIYKAITELRKLRHLTLQLDIYNPVKVGLPVHSLPGNSEEVRQILVNMAVDATLAKEIAHLIFSRNPRIETVFLDVGNNATGILGDVARYMKHQWRCVRVPQNQPEDFDVDVREINVARRKRRQDGEATTELLDFTAAFDSLWPPHTGSPTWRYAWHSFPLHEVEE